MANGGGVCRKWKDATVEGKYFNVDGSKQQAKNYCRNINSNNLPLCFLEDGVGNCILKICSGEIYNQRQGSRFSCFII